MCKDIADYFYPISILDKQQIYEKCYEIGIDGITSIATDMAVPTICFVAERLNLVSNSSISALNTTNKAAMREVLSVSNQNCPKFIEVDKFDKFLFVEFTFPLIIKPVDRSGSRGVFKIDNLSGLEKAIELAIEESFVKKCIVEEFIEGIEVSVESISWKGKHFILAITDKVTTGAPRFVELAHHQPSLLDYPLINDLKNITSNALDALEINYGASHSEFKITEKGEIFIIEIGARMGGDFIGSQLVNLSTGYGFLEGVLKIALNQFEIPVLNNIGFAGVYFLSKETEFLLPYFLKANKFDVEKEILNKELKYIASSNDRSGYLIYNSDKKVDLY
ncbi:acetyl-CoA carboxylase biotin carboxylase subunit family protein [Flavobacterium sp. ACAM 123]|uniref:ATP-grasp domain-containing protein n=1 Tax=Flavobacterium sp. ACAM 123 TaxID=1189620 RepID=UPI0003688B42|nr:ATP-grasp domain-containing protein [Flavobacterium sp. ACAM 123]